MLRTLHLVGQDLQRDLSVEAMRAALASKKGVLWVDLEDATPEETELLGPALFGFHPLAIEDCVNAQSRPKVDDFEDHVFLVFHAWNRGEAGVQLEEIDFFLGPHYVVSYHQEKRSSVDAVFERALREPRATMPGADVLLHQIVDRMVDRYEVVVDAIDERVDELEGEILGTPGDDTMRRILDLRRDLQELFRTVRHQRDVVNSLAREGHPTITKKTRQFFRDVYDHVVRVHDTVEGLREQVGSARDAYLSIISNRMNEIMKGLSLVATLILPLTLVTGVYGMNFERMPLVKDPQGFLWVCTGMAALGILTLVAFRRRGWA